MTWQLIIREGLSYSAMARLGELALALRAIPQSVQIVCGASAGWLRLFSPAQQQVLQSIMGPSTDPGRVVWCGSGATMPPFPPEATWCVLAEDAATLPNHVADRYERVIALVDGARNKPHVTYLPGCAGGPMACSTRSTLLVVASGRAHQDAAFVADLCDAGAKEIALFNPYIQGAWHAQERRAFYARCGAAIGVGAPCDDYFLQEAQACLLPILGGVDAAARQRAVRAWSQGMTAASPSLSSSSPAVMSWHEVAQTCVTLAHTLAMPSGAQIQQLLSKMQGASHLPTVLLKAPTRPNPAAAADAMVGFSAASDSICQGLTHQVEALFNLRWLLNTPDEVSRRRLYHYPYQRQVGLLGDEMDYAHLPTALRHRQIDMLCTTQSYTHGLIAARAAWATRALPVLGMLHAVHASALVSETLLQLLDGPSLPCDAFISPTACGVRAHQHLVAAATAHLGQNMPRPPTYAGTYHVIPYGIDRTPFLALHPLACRQALNLPMGVPIALSLGRFLRHEKADLMPLLLAWQAVTQVHPQALLALAGSHDRGTYARQIRAICAEHGLSENVLFFENVSTSDKHLLFGAADLFVTVSDNLQETYGLTVIEAMASGLPVVAAGWDGYQETVRHGETGFLVPTHMVRTRDDEALLQRIAEGIMGAGHRDVHETVVIDVQHLATSMRTLIDDPSLRMRMGAAARALCAAEYDQDTQAARMRGLFLSLVEASKGMPWSAAPRPTPFRDRITERFAHYASEGYLQETQSVALSRHGADAGVRRRILQQAGWATPDCCKFTDALCAYIGDAGDAVTIGAALDTLPGDRYRHLLQVARLLKYGILRFN